MTVLYLVSPFPFALSALAETRHKKTRARNARTRRESEESMHCDCACWTAEKTRHGGGDGLFKSSKSFESPYIDFCDIYVIVNEEGSVEGTSTKIHHLSCSVSG